MENRKLYIFGASGHGKVVAELVASTYSKIEAMIDDAPKTASFGQLPILNTMSMLPPKSDVAMIIAIGNNLIRKKVSSRFSSYNFFTSIHKTAFVSPSATVGLGTVVMVHAIINSDAKIGNHVIINTAALVEHDCSIADFVHISPKVTLSGNVSIGLGSHIGSGVIVIPGVKIGKWCTVGAGSVVINDIPDGVTVVGNPGKIIENTTVLEPSVTCEKIFKKKKVIKINSDYRKFNIYKGIK
ncbi:acetyltransferase [Flavobacterium sp. XS2P39]|uniref:acetyltransferase n=1 Tax=Flavobacterium sp. XS2P39 TaxID=3401725 RepID=UPI003AB0849F